VQHASHWSARLQPPESLLLARVCGGSFIRGRQHSAQFHVQSIEVEVRRDDVFSTIAAAVDITAADGVIHKMSQTAARGSDANPMDDTGLEEKLRTAAAGWDRRHDAVPLIDAIWALDKSADVSELARLAVPH
jgi:hypothetical protein